MDEDAMGGSLFEGMVLFSPSDLTFPSPGDEPAPSSDPPASPATVPAQEPHPPSPGSASVAQPLDEDLFSDLSIQIQPPLSIPSPTSPLAPAVGGPAAPSRKKKRAVRIGYGRAAADSSASPAPQLSPTASASSSATAASSGIAPVATISASASSGPLPPDDATSVASTETEEHAPSRDDLPPPPPHQDEVVASVAANRKDEASAASIAPVAEKFESVEDSLRAIKSQISQSLVSIRRRADNAFERRKEAATWRWRVAAEASAAVVKHKEMEVELSHAIDADDFVEAERISTYLQTLVNEKDRLLAEVTATETECDVADSEIHEVLELLIAAEEAAAASFERLAMEAAEYADSVSKNAEDSSSKEIDEWQASMELIETEKLEMEIESQLIMAAMAGLEGSIEHLIEDDKREKAALIKKGNALAEELASLLELVRLKEAEIEENNLCKQAVEERISSVLSQFHASHIDVTTKLDKLQEARMNASKECEALTMKKKQIDHLISLAEQKKSWLKEVARLSSDKAKSCLDIVTEQRNLVSPVVKSRQDLAHLANMRSQISGDVSVLKQQISDARSQVQELTSRKTDLQQEITALKLRIEFIDKRSPILEAEKKTYAAARNFKEASRIASEAKALNSEKEELQVKWDAATKEMGKLELEISGTANMIQEIDDLVSVKQKELAIARYKGLQIISAAAKAEMAVASQGSSGEEAELWLKEIEDAERKASEFEECYMLQPGEDESATQNIVSVTAIIKSATEHLAEMASFSLESHHPQ